MATLLCKWATLFTRICIDDRIDAKLVFSRDCPEYVVELPNKELPNKELLVLCPNHFKSKRGSNDVEAQARRSAQASRAAEIVLTAEPQVSKYVLLVET